MWWIGVQFVPIFVSPCMEYTECMHGLISTFLMTLQYYSSWSISMCKLSSALAALKFCLCC